MVAFYSHATTLVPDDTNSSYDAFVHDLRSGVTSRVSVDSAGGQLPGGGYQAAMSADGNTIAFTTYTSGTEKVFVHDRTNGTTTRVSLEGCISNDPAISGDGNVVAYVSCAFPGPDGSLPYGWQLLAFDRTTGETSVVSVDSSGNPAGAGSSPQVSFDGRYVAFDSGLSNLVAGDTNGFTDVFVRDRAAGVTTMVSMGGAGDTQGDNQSCWPGISDDGRLVVFTSWATNLVPGDTNAVADLFSFDRETGALTRLSVNSDGVQGDGNSSTYGQTISGDGRFVAFTSGATNLVPGDTNSQDDAFVTAINWTATPVTVTAEDKMIAAGEPLPALTFTANGFETPDTFVTAPVCTTTATDSSTAGSYPITCSGGVAPLGYTVTYTAGTLTIHPISAVTVHADSKSMTSGDPLPELTHTAAGFTGSDTFTTEPTCSTTATSASLPGDYPITCSGGAAASWYTLSYQEGTLSVNPITVTVTADNQTMTAGDSLPPLTYSTAGFVSPDTFTTEPTCSTTATSASPAGDYPITCSGGVVDSRYALTYVGGTLTVAPRLISIDGWGWYRLPWASGDSDFTLNVTTRLDRKTNTLEASPKSTLNWSYNSRELNAKSFTGVKEFTCPSGYVGRCAQISGKGSVYDPYSRKWSKYTQVTFIATVRSGYWGTDPTHTEVDYFGISIDGVSLDGEGGPTFLTSGSIDVR